MKDAKTITQNDIALNTAYRIIIFICFAASAASICGILVLFGARTDPDGYGDEFFSVLTLTIYGYFTVLAGSAAAVVFSILSYKSASAASLILRTLSSVIIFVLYLCEYSVMRVLWAICGLVSEYGAEYLTQSPSPEDLGLSQDGFNNMVSALANADGNKTAAFAAGLISGVFIYLILSVTSAISLVRRSKVSAADGIAANGEAAAQDGLCANDKQR